MTFRITSTSGKTYGLFKGDEGYISVSTLEDLREVQKKVDNGIDLIIDFESQHIEIYDDYRE